MIHLHPHDMEDLATGAAILGTGGGGDPYRGRLLAETALREHGPVALLDPQEVGTESRVIGLWNIGAPVVGSERLQQGDEGLLALRALEKHLGWRADAVAPAEVGGSNSTMPIRVAAQARLPVVDCDGMGRAFPEVHLVTATFHGAHVTPAALVDAAGNTVVLDTGADDARAERLSRAICVEMGGACSMAAFPMTGATMREAMIPGTMSLARRLGVTLREARAAHHDPVEAILSLLGGFRLAEGKIVDVDRRLTGGWARGHFELDAGAHRILVDFQNEYLRARTRDGRLLAIAPDLIMAVESATGEPVITESLRYGFRVALLGIPCDRRWRTPAGLALGGPAHFGYEDPWRPVEHLAAETI